MTDYFKNAMKQWFEYFKIIGEGLLMWCGDAVIFAVTLLLESIESFFDDDDDDSDDGYTPNYVIG